MRALHTWAGERKVQLETVTQVHNMYRAPNPPPAAFLRTPLVLELPLASASVATVRKAYRKVSLQIHPDKVSHPKASEAFRKAFDAMKTLIEPSRQAARLKAIERGELGDGDGGSSLPPETRWWEVPAR